MASAAGTRYQGKSVVGRASGANHPAARVSLIHVRDLVAAIIACVETGDMPNTAYELSDGREAGYDWGELAKLVEAVWQRRVRLLRIPAPLLNGVAACNLLMSRIFGYAPMLTPAKLRELRHRDWMADNRELQTAVDWRPCIDLQQGLTEIKESEL